MEMKEIDIIPQVKEPKQTVLEMLEGLPSDVGFEEIIYNIEILSRMELSEQDVIEGNLIPHDEIKEIIKSWNLK